jgi:hypothetical protein
MHVAFEVTRENDYVVPGKDTTGAQAACIALNADVRSGIKLTVETAEGPKGHADALGLTAVWPLGKIDFSKRREGEATTSTGYYCAKVNKYFSTEHECRKECPKPSTAPDPNSPFLPNDTSCKPQSLTTVTYKVFWTYTVRIHYRVVHFKPHGAQLSAEEQRQVTEFNDAILAHEEGHVEKAQKAAEKELPEEKTYIGTGPNLMVADDDVFGQIGEDKARIIIAFGEAMRAQGILYHSEHGGTLAFPKFCKL